MIVWRVNLIFAEIIPMGCLGFDQDIVITEGGIRHRRQSHDAVFFDSWDDAHKCLIHHMEEVIKSHEMQIKTYLDKLYEIKKQKMPEKIVVR